MQVNDFPGFINGSNTHIIIVSTSKIWEQYTIMNLILYITDFHDWPLHFGRWTRHRLSNLIIFMCWDSAGWSRIFGNVFRLMINVGLLLILDVHDT